MIPERVSCEPISATVDIVNSPTKSRELMREAITTLRLNTKRRAITGYLATLNSYKRKAGISTMPTINIPYMDARDNHGKALQYGRLAERTITPSASCRF